jgi:hypothetical protein
MPVLLTGQKHRRHPEVLAASGGEPRRMGHKALAAILRDAAQARGSSEFVNLFEFRRF